MKEDFKRETKMAMLTYGSIATIYIGILYIFIIFLFPEKLGITISSAAVVDIKTAVLMAFVFAATAISVYRSTKIIESKYIRTIATFIIPIIVLLIFKDTISLAIILMAAYFMGKGIYSITPSPKKLGMKIFKLILIIALIIVIFFSAMLLMEYIGNSKLVGSMDMSNIKLLTSNSYNGVSLIIAILLFMSFSTKEIIKEVLNRYKPTREEIGKLIAGTVIMFVVMVVLTSGIQAAYKLNMPEGVLNETLETNRDVRDVLLDTSNSEMTKQNMISDIFNKFDTKDNQLQHYYAVDMSKILLNLNSEKYNVTNSDELQAINEKYADQIDKLEPMIIENYNSVQSTIYNVLFGLFVMFILIEVYEQIRIVQLLKKEEKK